MTAIHPIYAFRNMSNQFTPFNGGPTINFVNKTPARESVSLIEILTKGEDPKAIRVDTDDNVAMALAVLGVGRVTDKIEEQAQRRAQQLQTMSESTSVDDFLKTAVINLRAILIAKQREAEDSEQLTKEAYNLYKLSYPSSTKDLAMFIEQKNNHDYWVATLKRIRQDPTALDSL